MMQYASQRRQWKSPIIAAVILSGIASLTITLVFRRQSPTLQRDSQAAYDKVMKTNSLRCAYLVRPPNVIKDPNTGQLSGIVVDFTNELGRRLGFKIEWVEEVSWGTMIEGLNTGRYDMVASGIWANSTRGRAADFTIPLFYTAEGVFTRADETRFASGIVAMNDPSITIATMDGEMSSIIAAADFPKTKTVSLPQFSDTSQLLLEVTSRKADVTFVDTTIAARYMKHNPGKIVPIKTDKPIRILPNCMMLRKGQYELESVINTAATELILSGVIDDLIKRYDDVPNAYYRVAVPYSQPHPEISK